MPFNYTLHILHFINTIIKLDSSVVTKKSYIPVIILDSTLPLCRVSTEQIKIQLSPNQKCKWHYIQWGKKVFSQPPIVQVLPLKKMREACNFHHRYTSTMRDKIRKRNPENHIVGFLKNLFANYGGK